MTRPRPSTRTISTYTELLELNGVKPRPSQLRPSVSYGGRDVREVGLRPHFVNWPQTKTQDLLTRVGVELLKDLP